MIDSKTKTIITALQDEKGNGVHSEKLLEIDFKGNKGVDASDQFGLGRVEK